MGHSTQLTASSTCGLIMELRNSASSSTWSGLVSSLLVVLLNQSYKMFSYVFGGTQPKVKEKLLLL